MIDSLGDWLAMFSDADWLILFGVIVLLVLGSFRGWLEDDRNDDDDQL